ncbi:protein tyrosine phosphatase [Tistlia consotensis]|uniref:protein-tyrosine-phosphatase n=1 Tax=Tistlia consotensis USBA 355 TaxID=560819 RepID=A0A1Y6CNU3_9PROT|nr:low molecular weight protein-tyrosine-phosphatase [Tistlia consotensis]SMF78160.1 protein tyrosine phosphatase [Tistlia consotensis USBA 355]SNS17955.1 protein tyrosine phosphatase [Tistlia consotensis]
MRLLFVCTGNICRSPTAEAVMRAKLKAAGLDGRVEVDSCGTTGWHVGEPPSGPALEVAGVRGYDLSDQRARQIAADDFERFDRIFAMDRGHHGHLLALCPDGRFNRLRLFREASARQGESLDVPDPYGLGIAAYETAFEMIERGCEAILEEVRAELDGEPAPGAGDTHP